MTTVSIITPVHDAAETLERTVASVLAQDFDDWELIIVDDASSDDSLAIAEDAAAADPRIRVLAQAANAGPSAARNRAIAAARGAYLAFLDADDLWRRDKLSTHVAFFRAQPAVDLSFARVSFFSDCPRRTRHRSRVATSPPSLEAVIAENPVCTMSNLVVRREVIDTIGGFDERLVHAEDQEFLVRALQANLRLEGLQCELVLYRTSRDGLSADLEAMRTGWLRMLDGIPNLDDGVRRRAFAIYHRYLARRALRLGKAPSVAVALTRAGLDSALSGFFSDLRRGVLTLAGVAAATVLPCALRRRLFADSREIS
jgi:glycosyltransferase involved in cell wall biosynthesis